MKRPAPAGTTANPGYFHVRVAVVEGRDHLVVVTVRLPEPQELDALYEDRRVQRDVGELCGQAARGVAELDRNRARWSDGPTPTTRRNACRMVSGLPKPEPAATASMGVVVRSSSSRAASTRMRSTKRAGVMPVLVEEDAAEVAL